MAGAMNSLITTHESLESYFSSLVSEALEAQKLDISPASSAYVIQLVKDFSRSEALVGGKPEETGTPALFRLYERAVNAEPSGRFDAYRHLGDVALFVSGFFAAHVERSLVTVDYYVDMGRTAYQQAAGLARGGAFADVLDQLARSYNRVVELLTSIAEKTTLPVRHDVAALLERWMRDGNKSLSERLITCGSVPVLVGKAMA